MARRVLAAAVNIAILASSPAPAFANQVESAVAGYSDNDRTNTIVSGAASAAKLNLFGGTDDHKTELSLGYTHRFIKFKETVNNAYLIKEQLKGKDEIEQYTFSGGIDQQLTTTLSVGALAGITESPLGTTKWLGLRAGEWWRSETFQTTFEARRTEVEQVPGQVYDDDRRIVLLPEHLAGNNFNLGFMHFTTPELIWRGSYSRTLRSDRPPADGITSELRYFLTPLQAAVHGTIGHYENVGEVSRNTSFGSIVANSVSGEWHQRLMDRFILMGGYRWYKETENTRTVSIDRKTLGSDWLYGSLRWRFSDGPWLGDSHEWTIFGGQYRNSEPRNGSLVGTSLKIDL